jgi:hypothetical protein
VLHFPVALADHVRGNLSSGCLHTDVAKYAGLPNNPYPHINDELLLMSRMDVHHEDFLLSTGVGCEY